MSNLKQVEQALQRFCFMLHVEGSILEGEVICIFFFMIFFYLRLVYKFWRPYWFCKLVLDENCLVKLLADSASCSGMCWEDCTLDKTEKLAYLFSEACEK